MENRIMMISAIVHVDKDEEIPGGAAKDVRLVVAVSNPLVENFPITTFMACLSVSLPKLTE